MRALLILASAAASVCVTTPCFAEQATGIASVRVVNPLTVTRSQDLEFGILRGGAAAGTVRVTPQGAVTTSGGATLLSGAAAHPARFNITGDAGRAFRIDLPEAYRDIGERSCTL